MSLNIFDILQFRLISELQTKMVKGIAHPGVSHPIGCQTNIVLTYQAVQIIKISCLQIILPHDLSSSVSRSMERSCCEVSPASPDLTPH
jgi:hypothetical protein